jgi:hypothetical protein
MQINSDTCRIFRSDFGIARLWSGAISQRTTQRGMRAKRPKWQDRGGTREQTNSDLAWPREYSSRHPDIVIGAIGGFQIVVEVWRDVLQPPIDSNALRQPRQRGTQQGVPLNIDLFAASKTRQTNSLPSSKSALAAISHRSNLRPRPGWCVGGALASPSSWRYAQSSWPASMSIENSSHPVSEEQFSS